MQYKFGKPDVAITHDKCQDGFGSLMAIWELWGDDVIYHPGKHGEEPPYELCKDKNVIIADFSYPKAQLAELAIVAKSVTVLDHHVSAQKDLEGFERDNVEIVFDMERSGAVITWDYLHEKTPQLIKHIGDRDIWKFELENTKEISVALFSYPYDTKVWHDIIYKKPISELVEEGTTLNRKHMKDVNELIEAAQFELVIDGHTVPALNCPYFHASEAGNIMSKDAPFAACFMISKGKVKFGLRSQDDGEDVSVIAKKFGGGGHRNASGFSVDFVDNWVDNLKSTEK